MTAPAVSAAGRWSIAALGGGTGLPVVLRGLKRHVGEGLVSQLTAIVTVTDDGGSSGRLRRQFGVLPPGDIRNCIVAVADDEDLLARLFQYRFSEGDGLEGHSFGNLFLTALAGVTGDFAQAISTAETVLSVRGRILPASLTDVRLQGLGRSGRFYDGEVAVGSSGEALDVVRLDPPEPKAFPDAVVALEEADLIVLGPGSLYTSILPNLLIPGIRDAVRGSGAPKILVLNLMTEPGETEGMDALAHVEAIERVAGSGLVDHVLLNDAPIPGESLEVYAEGGATPVLLGSPDELQERGITLLPTDLLAAGDLVRHDPAKVSHALLDTLKTLDVLDPRAAPFTSL